ncbi:MAG: ATP-binding cassette domain-containing protein, partial [Candidatus Cloacimonadaceae bacterium]|nr:ATP-binding cassette domain-containing protein [Candidatus Cloacimonadaceae bacterium]
EEIAPDGGSVKVGVNTHFSYYKQEDETFNPNLSVYDYIAQFAEVIKTRDGTKLTATEMLNRFLFDGKMQQMKLQSLSGGERKRLYLLKSLMFGANFIILDEPTNDLDIKTLEILEDYLDAFAGCLLVVSHDRYFLDRTVDYLFIFENGKLRKFAGNYSDYLLVKRFQKAEEEEALSNKTIPERPKRLKKGLSYNEQQELINLERQMAELESTLKDLESILHSPPEGYTHRNYADLNMRIQQANDTYEKLFERWGVLSELAEG